MEPVATPSWEPYHVFINHRGTDTKQTLASVIYHVLEPHGLRVFLDQYVLSPGDTIETEIRGAISSSSVHIALFSKNYAESRWCLKELCWMLTSSHEPWFIPIFCDVEPWELRFIEKGCYAKAFQTHRQRESMEVVDEWKEALGKAADISGKVLKGKEALGKAAGNSATAFIWKESDDYGKLLRDIENTVMEHVKRDSLEMPPHPVGLEQAWKVLHDQIKKQSSKKVVVIAGLGGIGKSTLARYIFNELSRSEFRRASYLLDVRGTDYHHLQQQLCRDLLGKNMLHSLGWGGKTMLRKSLKGLKVLIVFDDVDKWDKIEHVLDVHAVEEGSLIFVTSCDKDVVRASYKNTSFVYDVQPLKNNHARELFRYHANRQSNSLEGCADLVEQFLEICGGLPLCLEVLGEQLSSNSDRTHWQRQLTLYSQGASLPEADDVINRLLKWSCKDMEREQRRMLLDVAYFLVGEDKELAVQVLEGLDYTKDVHYYLRRLRKTYLISFKNDVDYSARENWAYAPRLNWADAPREASQSLSAVLTKRSSKMIMHNEVREMARCLVREDQSEPLRLRWAVDFEKQSGSLSREVRGICIRKDQRPSQLPMDIKITGVSLLLVEHPIDDLSTFLDSIYGNLVWLRWRVSPFISLPSTISVRNLRVLELQGLQDVHLENFFSSIHERPLELRVIDINLTEWDASSSSSIIADPDDSLKSFDGNVSPSRQFLQSIGNSMKNLNSIVLKGVIVERSLPFDFSELKMLRHLDLSGSSNLTTLPDSFSELSQLQHLALRDCTDLSFKADILGKISTLEHIDFKGCAKLERLPDGIGSQRDLRYLNLLETSLLELPSNLQPLCKLEQLKIGSESFRELPCSVAFLGKLKELFLVGCLKLEHISIEQLTCLERLEIYASKMRILPAGISLLKHLKVLTIISSPIENFSLDNNAMYALTDLTLIHTRISDLSIPAGACRALEIVDVSHNRRLREVEVSQSTIVNLNLEGCEYLQDVELSQSTLVKLNLEGCQNLQHMNLPKLGRLKFLNIKRCGYVAIQNVAECGSLEEIRAEECRFTIEAGWNQLERPAWSQLQRLNFFTFSQELVNFCRRWPKHSESLVAVKEYEESRVRKALEFPNQAYYDSRQAYYDSRLVLEKEYEESRVGKALESPNQAYYDSRQAYYDSRLVLEKEFEELLNSFNGVTLLEVAYTAYYDSPLMLEKVSSHSAILMCFITHYRPWDNNYFLVSFDKCFITPSQRWEHNCGSRPEEFEIRGDYDGERTWVHVFMWTKRSTLFTDEDNIYNNVSIFRRGVPVEGGDRGWILTFSSENHVLDALNQIINHSAESGLDSAG